MLMYLVRNSDKYLLIGPFLQIIIINRFILIINNYNFQIIIAPISSKPIIMDLLSSLVYKVKQLKTTNLNFYFETS